DRAAILCTIRCVCFFTHHLQYRFFTFFPPYFFQHFSKHFCRLCTGNGVFFIKYKEWYTLNPYLSCPSFIRPHMRCIIILREQGCYCFSIQSSFFSQSN